MKAKHLAICIKNRQGFTITGREIEDGQVILRMQNFRQGDTNVITLDPEGVRRLREYLQALEAKAGVPQMTQEQSKFISDSTREAYVRANREPVLARPEHGCSVEEAMSLTMERYGQPGGALEQLAELERNPVRDYCVRSAERMRQTVHVVCHNCDLGKHPMLMRADVDISTIEAPKCLCGAQTEWAK